MESVHSTPAAQCLERRPSMLTSLRLQSNILPSGMFSNFLKSSIFRDFLSSNSAWEFSNFYGSS